MNNTKQKTEISHPQEPKVIGSKWHPLDKLFLDFFSSGIFQHRYRNQLLTTLSVTIISFCHGLNLGWLSPMLPRLKEITETPVNFVVNIDEVSWVGSSLSIGGIIGGIFYSLTFERVGRKISIFLIAIPNILLWILIYFAQSVEYIYAARFFGGMTGCGIYLVIPVFISEIADNEVRGRLSSMFSLSQNIGIFMGFLVTSNLQYHMVPSIIVTLPILALFLAIRYPEPPQYLLRHGRDEEAKESFKFYKNCQSPTEEEFLKLNADFIDLQAAVMQQKIEQRKVGWGDFCNKRAVKGLSAGMILYGISVFSGHFAIINYMSSVFAVTKSKINPNTNSIIIGLVQIIGSYVATSAVDHYGRRILMLSSYGGMAVGLAAFGMYAFVAEETDADLSAYSWWAPLLLMSFIIFICNLGVTTTTFVVFIEILPTAIRSVIVRICLPFLCVYAFASLKMFPLFLASFGLSTTMWFCSSVCAFGTFYTSVFIPETRGKSMDRDEGEKTKDIFEE